MFFRITSLIVLTFLLLQAAMTSVWAQAYERDLSTSAKSVLTIRNRAGRVSVVASDSEKDKPSLKAISSTGAAVEP
ncbi:MAG TPA: hypothetical protein VHQ64_00890, partial [Pyrinomonadaceae bacterium]|nr:hypothetical protein [Pyrinomonadaceae bacterium]